MSNFLIKGNSTITYFTMDGTTAKSIPSYTSISEVHTISRDKSTISVWRANSRINAISTFEPNKTYIVYTKPNTGDFTITTNGINTGTPDAIRLVSSLINSSIGTPFMFVWPEGWRTPINISDYDRFIKIIFAPSTNGKMLRSYIPNSRGNGFLTFDRGNPGLPPKGYTVWATAGFTLYNPDVLAPTATPFATRPPATPQPTPTQTPNPTASPTPNATPFPTRTPDPTVTVMPEYAIFNISVISRNPNATAVIEYTTDWSNPSPQWTPLSVFANNVSNTSFSKVFQSQLSYIKFRIRNLSSGTGYYTTGLTSPYNQNVLTTTTTDQLYTQYSWGQYNITFVLDGLPTTPPPTATPNPTNPPTSTPYPTNPPTGTPGPTNLPTRTPDPTASPSPTQQPTRTPSATPTRTPSPTPTETAIFYPSGNCITGRVYRLPEGQGRLFTDAELAARSPIGTVTIPNFNITARDWTNALVPSIPNLLEWFQIEFTGWIRTPLTGVYTFDLLSDDGVKFYIDDNLVISDDSVHPPRSAQGTTTLTAGYHRFRLSYFQGPRQLIALYLTWRQPGQTNFTLVNAINDFVCPAGVATPTPTPSRSPTPSPSPSATPLPPTPTPTLHPDRIWTFANEDVITKESSYFVIHR